MHNIKLIRKDPDFFLKKLNERNANVDLNNLLNLDKKNRELIQNKEKLEQEKKLISQKKDKSLFKKSKELSLKIEKLIKDQTKTKLQIDTIFCSLPNFSLDDVPVGKNAS